MLAISVLVYSCGDSTASGNDPGLLVEQGWEEFNLNKFPVALQNFERALESDPNHAGAHLGAGWMNARLGNLESAQSHFEATVTNGNEKERLDGSAGKSVVDLALGTYSDAVTHAQLALGVGSSEDGPGAYSFEHSVNMDAPSLNLVRAQAHFLLGEYGDAIRVLQFLDDDVSLTDSNPKEIAKGIAALYGAN